MKGKFNIAIRMDLPPHPHDARIMDLAQELRRLINERFRATVSLRQKGRTMSDRTKAKLSAAQMGKKRSEEARDRMSRIAIARNTVLAATRRREQLAQRVAANPWADL